MASHALLGIAAAMAAAVPGHADARAWQGSWAAAPAPPMTVVPSAPAEWASPVIAGQTVVQQLRLSAGGKRLRIRLSNEYGNAPLNVGRVRVTLLDAAGRAAGALDATFSGAAAARIGPGEPLLSDPIDLAVPDLAELRVSIFFPGPAVACTCHADGGGITRISPPGDFVERPFEPALATEVRPFLTAIEVERDEKAPVVVAFGDSITDGYLSSTDRNRRWPDRLAERLAGDPAMRGTAVVNGAISGNRLLLSDEVAIFGKSALERFDRDVLAVPGVSHLVLLEGINDIIWDPAIDPAVLIAGYRQIIARAHGHDIKVILGTIMPYGNTPYFDARGEAARQAVNRWIRSGGAADGFVDFDAAMRDPADPTRLKAALQADDWLHPNDAGYALMGDIVPLDLFR